jgi:hypothetical protein
MATTTTNFGWDIPQSTDLVKDGAVAIAALGQDIDTALVDLKGGTTGQVLAKASGTDLDFSWVAQDDSNAIQNAIVDAKGDLIAATAADTPARLAVGTNGQVLTADSTASTGLKWASPAAGSLVYITQSSFTTSSAVNVNNCFTSTYRNYKIVVNIDSASADAQAVYLKMRASGTDSSASYYWYGLEPNSGDNFLYTNRGNNVSTGVGIGYQGLNGISSSVEVWDPQLSQITHFASQFASSLTSLPAVVGFANGTHNVASSYDGFSLVPGSGTITGIVRVYGYANS